MKYKKIEISARREAAVPEFIDFWSNWSKKLKNDPTNAEEVKHFRQGEAAVPEFYDFF